MCYYNCLNVKQRMKLKSFNNIYKNNNSVIFKYLYM